MPKEIHSITQKLKTILLELQTGEVIALSKLSKLTGEKISKCEAQLKHLLKSNQVIGSYSEYNQVFISKDTELFCQVHSGKFISSLPHHTCTSCGRNICCHCIGQLMDVGLVACVYCDAEFDPRPIIEVLISSDDEKLRNYGKGLNSMDVKNFEVAAEAFSEYVKLTNEDVSGLFELAFSLHKSGKYNESIHYWEKINRIRPRHLKTLIYWGNTLQELGNYKEAILKYQQANQLQPQHAVILMNWGVALKRLGRFEDAIHKYLQANKIRPNNVEILVNWGNALWNANHFEDAIQKYQQANKIRPNDANTLYNWGLALWNTNCAEEAILKYQQANNIRPNHADTLMDWGNALQDLGYFEEAISKYQQADTIRSHHVNTLMNWGVALKRLGRYEDAIQKYQQANKIRPDNATNFANWGTALKKAKRFQEAKKLYERAALAMRKTNDSFNARKFENLAREIPVEVEDR
jgi:tetratricopeptide (TPR) repeat protein